MKIPKFYLIAAFLVNWMLPFFATAQVPQLIHYQGRIVVESVNFDGVGFFKFALVNEVGNTAYWTNDGTHLDGSEPDASVTLTVSKGLYSVLLGDATLPNMQIVPATVFANPAVHLRVWFNDGQHGFQLLTPDQRIAAVGYAIMAATAQTVSDGAITSEKISPGAVGSTQIADGAVDNTKLANSSITLNAGPGLAGGGTVALGGTILISNGGVTSLQGGGGITVSSATGSITLGTNASATNIPESLVTRDANGGFSAGTISAGEFVGGGAGLMGVAGTLRWENVSGLTQQAVPNTGYLASNAARITVTLPAVASLGDVIRVSGVGAGGWAVVPNVGQNVVGFAVGEGPEGSQGATGAVQFIGNDIWQPMNESLIAAGAVGSAQLASSITLGGTISAANFIGNGQGLTELSAASLSTGTLADTVLPPNVPRLDAETNTFTGTLHASGTFDVSNATIIGFDKISRSGENTWTGEQTFANVKVSATQPHMLFENPTSVGTIGLATDFSDPGHDFFTMGINMRAVAHAGFEIVKPLESAWGLALERDFFNGETVQHEAYFTDGGSFRPFVFVYSQASTAAVVSIENGVVTISQAQVNDYLIPGLRFQFTALSDKSGVSPGTFYRVKTVLSPTTFTFMDVLGGPAIGASASGGTMQRGGWGNAGYRVPLAINCDNYDNYDVAGGTALQVANTKPDYQTLVRFDNFGGNGVVLQLDEKWRLGTDLAGNGSGNFYLMNLNGGINDSVIQVDDSSRMAIGYKRSEDGYTPHTNTGTLDVNGPIVATRPALPASVVEGGFIVVGGTAYIGSGGIWRALSFAP